jgi:hypothetical protein
MLGITRAIGRRLAQYLNKPLKVYERHDPASLHKFMRTLEPGDILLVDGNSRISTAIKYLTQSTWSHACLFVGPAGTDPDVPSLIEADLIEGVIRVPLSKFNDFNLRICRPVGLGETERKALIEFTEERLGYRYDLKNVFDLMRYLIQNPAVPPRYRRKMITLGSGEPTRAICSTLIAQAFQSVAYPILPRKAKFDPSLVAVDEVAGANTGDDADIVYQHRHFTHYVPRDFDLSPYFRVVKPTLELGFNYRNITWHSGPPV